MKLKQLTILLLTIVVLSAFVAAETESPIGQFTIGNAAPDAPYDWNTTTTHLKDQTFTWVEGPDSNGDPVTTHVCISADTDDDSCNVVNTVVSDPTYTFTQAEPNWDYTWGNASRTYYVKLTPNDGSQNGTANDTISFTLTDAIPTISGQTSDSSSDGDKDVGETITFSMSSHSDTDAADNQSLLVCNTNSVTTSGTCAGTEYCNEYKGVYSDDSDLSCTYVAQQSDNTSNTAYFFVCDCPPGDQSCPGQCSIAYSHTFYVNHAPTASNVDITPDNPTTSDTLTCSYTFADSDSHSQGTSTFRWFNWAGFWNESGVTTSTLASSYTTGGDIWMCEVTPVDQYSLAGAPVNSTNETVGNAPPNQPSDFEVQDGAASWDSSTIDTHDVTPNLRWNTSDPDGQTVTTYVCVAASASNRDNWNCLYDGSTTSDAVSSITGLAYNGTSVTYYVRLMPFDGSENGTAYDSSFDLINSVPNQPSSLSPLNTHSQTPTLSWTATDPDDGTDDHWPADTLTYHIRVGTSYGDGTYENNDAANKAGEIVDSAIPWGTPGTEYANTTAYVRIWTTDDAAAQSLDYDVLLNVYDYLPDVTNVEMTDADGTYSSCSAATCAVNPIQHSYSEVAIRVTATDTDNDCDANSSSTAYAYLCLDTGSCTDVSYDYGWQLDNIVRSGSTCTYEFSTNKTSGTPEFYQMPNSSYLMFVNVTSQAGKRTSDTEDTNNWIFGTLKAIDYPATVTLGDGDIDLNAWNNGTTLALMTNWGNDILDLDWDITDPTSGTDTWTIIGDDFQIDDDSDHGSESSGYLSPVYLNNVSASFQPGTGLEVCADFNCTSSSLNETLDTYYHIKPPSGLGAGTYNTTITITLT